MNPREVKLSPNFTLHELLWSDLAGRHARFAKNSVVRGAQKQFLAMIVDKLETIRGWYDQPVDVLSGMRDQPIHQALKAAGLAPSSKSDHSYLHSYSPFGVGAVDFRVRGVETQKVMEDIKKQLPHASFGTAIWYPPEHGDFIHIANPREALTLAHGVLERFRWRDKRGRYVPF